MYGIVVSVASLPVSRQGMISLTSVRLRTENGIVAYFFDNVPIAPTLEKGEWVAFSGGRSEWGGNLSLVEPKFVLEGLSRAKSVGAVGYFIECVKLAATRMAPHIVRGIPEGKELQRLVEDMYRRIEDFRMRLELDVAAGEVMPDDVVLDNLPKELIHALHWYRSQFRTALDAPAPQDLIV